ncbi:MAG: phytoene desaturase family protein [Candidatus Helarchaeota archaeon]
MSNYDLIIIGAGIAGLSLGALVSKMGKKVIILEKNIIGGRARIWRKNGYKVDFGIHTLKGAHIKILKELNEGLIPTKRLPLSKGFIIEDNGILHKTPKLMSMIRYNFINRKELTKLVKILLPLFLSNPDNYCKISIMKWLEYQNASENIIKLIKILCTFLLVSPHLERLSLGELIYELKNLKLGNLGHPIGGFDSVLNFFIKVIKKYGNTIITGKNGKVNEILIENETAYGVKIGNQILTSRFIVVAFPIYEIFDILDEKYLDKSFVQKIKSLRPTSGISIDFGIKSKIFKETGFITLDPVTMGFFSSNIDNTIAPKDKQLLTVYNILNLEDINDPNIAKQKLKYLKNKLFKMFPKLKDNIEWERPLFLKIVDGIEPTIQNSYLDRPGNIIPKIKNLFVASDTTNAHGTGGNIAFNSAWNCYQILKRVL